MIANRRIGAGVGDESIKNVFLTETNQQDFPEIRNEEHSEMQSPYLGGEHPFVRSFTILFC